MLVGILSMQRIVNYGSFMQAYSLKKMVESLGHRVVFVDYKPNVLIEDRNDKTKRQELLYQEIKHTRHLLEVQLMKNFVLIKLTHKLKTT